MKLTEDASAQGPSLKTSMTTPILQLPDLSKPSFDQDSSMEVGINITNVHQIQKDT